MMEIKGTAVIAIRDYVKINHKEEYTNWINALPNGSKDIFIGAIDSSKWYPIDLGGVIPTRKTAEFFFGGDHKKGAWESGKYSAQKSLSGVYKIFVKASSPGYIVQRASRVFATYYQPCKMEVIENKEKSVVLQISNMKESDEVIEYRVGGWIQSALEISGAKNVAIDFAKSITRGDDETLINISWE